MSFDKEYPNRKDRRKQYRKSASFDRSCRPGGDCPHCRRNRFLAAQRRREAAEAQLRELERE